MVISVSPFSLTRVGYCETLYLVIFVLQSVLAIAYSTRELCQVNLLAPTIADYAQYLNSWGCDSNCYNSFDSYQEEKN